MSESGAGASEPTGAETPEPEVPDVTETGFVDAGPITGADGPAEDGDSATEPTATAGAPDDDAVADGAGAAERPGPRVDAGAPDTVGTRVASSASEASAPEAATREAGTSVAAPEVSAPEAVPESATPEVAAPESATPEVPTSGEAAAWSVAPEAAAPEAAAPPDASAPESATPDGPAMVEGATPEAEPGVPESAAVGEAPDLTEDAVLDAALEALLLVVDVPAGEELLADTLDQPVARIRSALERLAEGYTQARRGLDLRRVGDGWRFYTRETYAPYVERYLLDGQRAKLTRAALETLAVVAYRQPVSRARVAAVRGVNVDGVIRTLVGRGLVEEAGTDPSTGGILYCTTELFLERLGLSSLKDLPPLAPLLPEVDAIDDV